LCTVTDIVEAITPHKLQSLRQLLNSTAMDIMYYTSPLYGCEVRYATDPMWTYMSLHSILFERPSCRL